MTRRCYLFDIDGTLADGEHRRYYIGSDPKDWDKYFSLVEYDKPIEHIVELAHIMYGLVDIVYVSGRSDECRFSTEQWLIEHCPWGPVYMRRKGDHRPDNIIKIELLGQIRQDGYDPILVFDDRTRVVNAWRAAGLPCLQVAPGDF